MPATQGTAPLTLAFTDTSTGDDLDYYWDFGDGNTSTLKNPTHTYVNQGFYSCILTVTNINGSNQASEPIVVNPAGSSNGYGGGNGGGGNDNGGNGGGNNQNGGNGCFIAGTLIQLPSSTIAIEYIKVGDVVKSFDVGTSSVVNSKVTETFVHSDRYYMIINGTIKTTSVHPFYSDGNWIEAGDLSIGDKILHVDGLEHTIETIELSDEPVTVYNFEVDGTHNYFAEGYLVHNKQTNY